MADIVDEFIKRLQHHMPDVPHDRVVAIELDVRQQWGGTTKAYIAKRPGLATQQRLAQALATGQPLEHAFASAGIKRRQGYNILGRRAR